jgi:hypothetical protein
MRKIGFFLWATVAASIAYYSYGDLVVSRIQGTPLEVKNVGLGIKLGSSYIEGVSVSAQRQGKDLRLQILQTFRYSGALTQPYMTVEENGQGIIHVGAKPTPTDFFSRCEFSRYFEVIVPEKNWMTLKSLRVINQDTSYDGAQSILAVDAEKLSAFRNEVEAGKYAALTKGHGGCG